MYELHYEVVKAMRAEREAELLRYQRIAAHRREARMARPAWYRLRPAWARRKRNRGSFAAVAAG